MTTSPACFNTLPLEIHALIVRQAYLQDGVYRTERQSKSAPFYFIRWHGWTWYGRSLMALYMTCKPLNALAEPLVFEGDRETLALSQTVKPVFDAHILKQHATSFKILIFNFVVDPNADSDSDSDSDGNSNLKSLAFHEQTVKSFFFSTFYHLVNIQQLDFRAYNATAAFASTLPLLRHCHLSEYDTGWGAVTKEAAQTLSNSISSIVLDEVSASTFLLKERFDNLKSVTILSDDEQENGLDATDIRDLDGLTSLSLTIEDDYGDSSRTLPVRWIELPWKCESTLPSLELSLPSVFDEEWHFVVKFASTLTTLKLGFEHWKTETIGSPERFTCLEELQITAVKRHISQVLRRISPPATLTKVRLTVVPTTIEQPEEVKDTQTFLKHLEEYHAPGRSLKVCPLPCLREEEDFTEANLGGVATLIAPSAWQTIEKRIWTHPAFNRVSDTITSADVISQLDFVRDQVLPADRVGDQAAMVEWARWMEPLVGRRNLGTY